MKIFCNGFVREMTAEEIIDYERRAEELLTEMPTPEERLSILENALLELGELLGGAE